MGIQVQELTHNLMPWGKEYIDFSFAGRHISEFGLVAVTSGDRYQFAGSPDFEDETSSVKGVWGQHYWGTNFKTKTYTYNLATDAMTERQFEDFKYHFRPGHYGQFYEDAWFDKYCYARIHSKVEFNFIPFQEEVEVAGHKFMGRVYKGEAKISFIQDRPFKYSFYQVLNSKLEELHSNNDNGQAALRMMYHSNIPARDSWVKETKCATGSWFSLPGTKSTYAKLDRSSLNIDDKNLVNPDTSIIFNKANKIYYYNPSSISAEPTISFTLDRSITPINKEKWQPIYFDEIYDEFTNKNTPYNVISTTSKIDSNSNITTPQSFFFRYGLPEVTADVNKAINIGWEFYSENVRGALADLQERLQEGLINSKVLLWSMKVLHKIQTYQQMYRSEIADDESEDGLTIGEKMIAEKVLSLQDKTDSVVGEVIFHSGDFENTDFDDELDIPGCFRPNKVTVYPYPVSSSEIKVDWFGYFNLMMLMMFAECKADEKHDILTKGTFAKFYPYSLKFSTEKGQAFVSYRYNYLIEDSLINSSEVVEENCSNIVASSYLKLDGGDTINIDNGKVASYHILRFNHGTDEEAFVRDIILEYKYTYL